MLTRKLSATVSEVVVRPKGSLVRAINARRGEIPLAAGEGLRLVATRDSEGRALDPACTYRVGGRTPPARAWTMTVEPRPGGSEDRPGLRTAFTSTEVLRETDGRFVIVGSEDRSVCVRQRP